MPSTTSNLVAQFECTEDQVPERLYRVRYSGNQSLKARVKPAFKSEGDFKQAVEQHLTWYSCERTPFVSLFANKDHAGTWAQRLLEHGYHDVVLLEVDASRLGSLFCVRDLVNRQGVHTTLSERMYEDEFLVLRKIPRRSVLDKTVVSLDSVTEEETASYHSSDSEATRDGDTELSRSFCALHVDGHP
ncbi:hypothetical protein PRIC1_006189 [Phytophthora ramorum]